MLEFSSVVLCTVSVYSCNVSQHIDTLFVDKYIYSIASFYHLHLVDSNAHTFTHLSDVGVQCAGTYV